jgi:hypothetical protein
MADLKNSEPADRSRKDKGGATRPQQAGEAETTRFGMEEGDNTDTPATGPASRGD